MGKSDDNNRYATLGYDSDNDVVLPFSIDNVTGYLRMSVTSMDTGTPAAQTNTVDSNSKGVAFGTEAGGTPHPLITDTNGNLRIIEA